jgi:hypothetical protein
LDATPIRRTRLQVSPLTGSQALTWRGVLQELPAVGSVELNGFTGGIATYIIATASSARLYAQLLTLARQSGALLTMPAIGELGLMLRPTETASPTERAVQNERTVPRRLTLVATNPAYQPPAPNAHLGPPEPVERRAWFLRLLHFSGE